MSLNIRDRAILESTAARLEELIEACKVRGAVYGIDPMLTRDVMVKAKGLKTSLTKLLAAVDEPAHKPVREEKRSPRSEIAERLYRERCLWELARWISYGGRTHEQLRSFLPGHRRKYGDKAAWALHELTMIDPATNLTVLRPDIRKACRMLLGPAPESGEYEEYWTYQGCKPPAEHLPPARDEAPRSAKRNDGRER